MKSKGSVVDLRYIWKLFLEWLNGDYKLQPISDYKFVSYEDLSNIHIFNRNSEKGKSNCGNVEKSRESVRDKSSLLTRNDAIQYAADLQLEGEDVCGNCVSSLYSNEDTKNFLASPDHY